MLGKTSSIGNGNSIFQLIQSLKNGNPQAIFNRMIQDNPQFAQFVEQNRGKSPEQIAKDYNVDISAIEQFLR
jgi:hypothetical protein